MDRRGAKTSRFSTFTGLASGLSRKLNPAPIPLSKSLGPPAAQTSLIVVLSDELILSILSQVAPEPQLIGHYGQLRLQYGMVLDGRHERRVWFLLPLSMTCRTMRLRLRSWIWERLECPEIDPHWEEIVPRRLNAIIRSLRADTSLTTNVRFMTISEMWNHSIIPEFIKCLKSLPNLHTLEISRMDYNATSSFGKAVAGVKLPQIQALTLPPTAHAILKCCHNVEDVVCVVMSGDLLTEQFCRSLASIRNPKIKRLAIPLILPGSPSKYVAALSRLTELTVLYPHPHDTPIDDMGNPVDAIQATRSAMSELVETCKALPDFNTLQIAHFLLFTPSMNCIERMLSGHGLPSVQQREEEVMEQVNGVKDLAINSLRKAKPRYRQGGTRKKTTFRIIELTPSGPLRNTYLEFLDIEEECEV